MAKIISPQLNEVLFRLHMSGSHDSDLVRLYEGTTHEFSLATLINAKKANKWAERKAQIIDAAKQTSSEAIEIGISERLKTMNKIINIVSDQIDAEYKEWAANPNPKNKPWWMPKNVKDLEIMFKLYDHVLSGGVQQHAIGLNAAPKNYDSGLSDGTRKNMLKFLAESATKEMANMDAVPVEFAEIPQNTGNATDELRDILEEDEEEDGRE